MQAAKQFAFARLVREFAAWRAVPEHERAAAAAWWWGPATALRDERQPMPAEFCQTLRMPAGSRFADAATMVMDTIAEQDELSRPEGFPRKAKPDDAADEQDRPKLAAE
jgi:hypothetical protein